MNKGLKKMVKRIISSAREGIALVIGLVFTLAAAPVIHWSGLDDADSCPSPEDIEKANKLAAHLRADEKNHFTES